MVSFYNTYSYNTFLLHSTFRAPMQSRANAARFHHATTMVKLSKRAATAEGRADTRWITGYIAQLKGDEFGRKGSDRHRSERSSTELRESGEKDRAS